MQKAARAIIKIDGKYIFMKRDKSMCNPINTIIKEIVFYATIGGHVEDDETYEDACLREVYEELGIKIKIVDIFHEEYIKELDKHDIFYNVEYISGKIGTGKGKEFTNVNTSLYGSYEIVQIKQNEIENYNILPLKLKEKLIEKELDKEKLIGKELDKE